MRNNRIEEYTFKEIFYTTIVNFEKEKYFLENLEYIKNQMLNVDFLENQDLSNVLNRLESQSSKEFLHSFKLLLSKIYFNDDQDLDLAMLRMNLDLLKNKFLDIY